MDSIREQQPLPPPQFADLKGYWDVLRKRRAVFAQVFILVMGAGIAATVLSKPLYHTRAKLLVPAASNSVSLVDASNPIATMLAAAQPDSVATQMQVLQSEPFLAEARAAAKIKARPDVVSPSVQVEGEQGTNIIQISVDGGDPAEIARLANTIVDLHLKNTDLNRQTGLDNTIEFVKLERKKAAERLKSASQKLLAFQRKYRIAELTAEQDASVKALAELKIAIRDAERNVTATRAEVEDLQAQLSAEPPVLTEQVPRPNPAYLKLEERLNDLLAQRSERLLDYFPGSDPVKAIDERIANLREQMKAHPNTISSTVTTPNPARLPLKTKLNELRATLRGHLADQRVTLAKWNDRRGLISELGPLELQQQTLTQERESAQSAFTMLSDRLRDLEIRSNARLTTARLIERAGIPVVPFQPRPAQNMALTLVIALCLACGVAFLQEYLDDRVASPDDLQRAVALPALGHVPTIGGEESRVLAALPVNSHITEAYRALRSSIGFAGIDAPIRRLQITSASKGEGKTLTAVNVAISMAADGRRVILVDADLRRPSVHRVLNLENVRGLSELLVGKVSVSEALQECGVENLQVIPSGPIPPNPAELLGSRRFEHLLEQLERYADIVVFDSAPCVPVTDPLIIASRMDGVVIVLHVGQTRKAALKQLVEQMGRARARVLGVVFNRMEQGRGGYYYHYYSQDSGEGYFSDSGTGRRRLNGKRPTPELVGAHPLASSDTKDDQDG